MTINEEEIVKFIEKTNKRINELEDINKKTLELIKRLSKEIDKTNANNKQTNLALQIMAKELKITDELHSKMNQRGYRFEIDPFL